MSVVDVNRRSERAATTPLEPSWIIAVGLVVGAAVWILQGQFDARFHTLPVGNDVWFEADLPTVADGMLHRWSDHSRNARHPLFPILTTIPTYALRALGLSDAAALRALITFISVLWGGALYAVARMITRRRLDALVFCALTCVSSGAMFWLAVPETYSLASLSLLTALALCAIDPLARLSAGWYTGAAAFALGGTSSNWMAAIFTAAVRHRWPRALQIVANSLCVVVALWAIQRAVFPTAEFFVGYVSESRFITPAAAGGPGPVTRVLLFHSVVMPELQIVEEPRWGPMMSVQHSSIGGSRTIGVVAAVLWTPMLVFGALGLFASGTDRGVRAALALTLAGQIVLYQLYGEETFLYTLNVAPLLILSTAAAVNTRYRRVVLGLALALIPVLIINNGMQLAKALDFFEWAEGAARRG